MRGRIKNNSCLSNTKSRKTIEKGEIFVESYHDIMVFLGSKTDRNRLTSAWDPAEAKAAAAASAATAAFSAAALSDDFFFHGQLLRSI